MFHWWDEIFSVKFTNKDAEIGIRSNGTKWELYVITCK
jgi:hypothetical protein